MGVLAPHSTGQQFGYAHGDHRCSLKLFQIAAETTQFGVLTLPVRFYYASVTLLLRSHYDNKIWLRLVYDEGDAAATLLRPRRWSYAFLALLYPLYIKSEAIMNHRLIIMLDDEVQTRRPWLSADRRLQF